MESTYVVSRGTRRLVRISRVIMSVAALVFVLLAIVIAYGYLSHSALSKRRPYDWALCLFAVLYAASCIRTWFQARQMLQFSVTIHDDFIRVGEVVARWDQIRSIEHPRRTFGLLFRLNTADGKNIDVYTGIENGREIEDIVRSKISA
jgi:hypothetical protein